MATTRYAQHRTGRHGQVRHLRGTTKTERRWTRALAQLPPMPFWQTVRDRTPELAQVAEMEQVAEPETQTLQLNAVARFIQYPAHIVIPRVQTIFGLDIDYAFLLLACVLMGLFLGLLSGASWYDVFGDLPCRDARIVAQLTGTP